MTGEPMQRLISTLFFLFLLCGTRISSAQGLEIDIVNGREAAIPVAIVPFAWEAASMPDPSAIDQIVRADLNRSGQFRVMRKEDVVELPARAADVRFPTWKMLKQDYLVIGRVVSAGEAGYRVEFELHDVLKQQSLLALALPVRPGEFRAVSHQIADLVYEKILGVRGAFWTRIAYVTSVGLGQNTQYALMVADSDGFNPQVVVRSREPLMSPAWSPALMPPPRRRRSSGRWSPCTR